MTNHHEPKEDYLSFLLRLIKTLPLFPRMIVVLVALLLVAAYGYHKLVDDGGSKHESAVYINGVPDPQKGTTTAPNAEAEEDLAAFKYHFARENKEQPEEKTILGMDDDHYIHYKLFADRCIWVNRHWDGKDREQWLRDPVYRLHDAHPQTAAPATPAIDANAVFATTPSVGRNERGLLGASYHPGRFHDLDFITTMPPIQGRCANPHPGQFRYWWGSPMDTCNVPMFRQFADGCTHYQLYNRCANAWDAGVVWTYCSNVFQHY